MDKHLLFQYQQLKSLYESLTTEDFDTAYKLKTDSSSLLASFDERITKVNQMVYNLEKYVIATESKVSVEKDPKPTNGARKASFDPRVRRVQKLYASSIRYLGELNAIRNHLNRMYYDCQKQYELGNMRYNRN